MTKEQVCEDLRKLLRSNKNIHWMRTDEYAAVQNALRYIEGSSAEPRAPRAPEVCGCPYGQCTCNDGTAG